VTEAARVGATRVLVPAPSVGDPEVPASVEGCVVVAVRTLREALAQAQAPAPLRLVSR
jgi:hypothetical protein